MWPTGMAELLAEAAPSEAARTPRRHPPEVSDEPAAAPIPASWLSRWVWLLTLSALVGVVMVASDIAGLVVLGSVAAYLLAPIVNALERRGVGRTQGAALVLLVLLALVGLLMALALPAALDQIASLQSRWQSGELLDLVRDMEASLAARFGLADPSMLGLVDSLRATVGTEPGSLIGYVPDALETMGNAFIVPFVLFALLKDGPMIRRRLLTAVPNRYFEFAMTVLFKADAHLGGYLRGQALIALLVGSSTALGLGLLGVEYYLVLGLLTGLANFVPYVGFVVSASLSVGVTIVTTGGMDLVGPVLILFVVLQTIENVVFQPWITGKNVSMHPVMVLLAILIGGRVGGVMGMALGVPAAAVLKVVFLETVVGLRRYHL